MPFTAAHPAIILPFLRLRNLSATALVFGSIAPDFEYFLRMNVRSNFSHSIPGIFLFDLPIVFFLSLAFHLVVKHSFLGNLPTALQQRCTRLYHFSILDYLRAHWFLFICSALLGIFSHLFWDAFTHYNGWFVKIFNYQHRISFLDYPLWHWLQHISSVVGLVIISLWIARLPLGNVINREPAFAYWMVVLLIAGIILAVRFIIWSNDLNFGNFIVSLIGAGCIALLITAFVFNRYKSSVRK